MSKQKIKETRGAASYTASIINNFKIKKMKVQEITQAEFENTTDNVLVHKGGRVATNAGSRGNQTNRSIWINTNTGKTASVNPKSFLDVATKTLFTIILTEE
jgi:hypothetical protein